MLRVYLSRPKVRIFYFVSPDRQLCFVVVVVISCLLISHFLHLVPLLRLVTHCLWSLKIPCDSSRSLFSDILQRHLQQVSLSPQSLVFFNTTMPKEGFEIPQLQNIGECVR